MHVLITGGGIIGLSLAYYLNKSGAGVTVIDRGEPNGNCSVGNAGMIVPSHFVPLAAPGMVEKGIRWMFNSKSPFYVRPSLDRNLVSWGWQFFRKANQQHADRSAIPLRDLSLLSKTLYQDLAAEEGFDFGLTNNGILMMFKTQQTGDEEIELSEKAYHLGLDVKVLTPAACKALQPGIDLNIMGAVHYRCDAHLSPHTLVKQLSAFLEAKGVTIIRNKEVTKIILQGNKVTGVMAGNETYNADELVIAGGAWSPEIARLAGIKIPMMPGKGYSFMIDAPAGQMNIAALLMEARVSVTPMNNQVRFGGTMELGAVNTNINMKRVQGIVESIPKYFPGIAPAMPAKNNVWYGFRPCSPDGLPYIGRSGKFSNLSIATGHGMMGLSLGPATGKLISELLLEEKTSMNTAPFSPDR